MGLATCYGIVQQNNGYIGVESEVGKGSVFTVYLPQVNEPEEDVFDDASINELPMGNETVLLAEDEPLVRNVVTHILRDHGYRVLQAVNGEEALRIAQQNGGESIDLLITDVVMPQMSGLELVRAVKATQPDLRIMLISGYNEDMTAQRHTLQKGLCFLQKPFTMELLLTMVREALDREEG